MIIVVFGRELYIGKKILVLAVCLLFAASGIIGYTISRKNKPIVFNDTTTEKITVKEDPEAADSGADNVKIERKPENQDQIKVYIVGCVKKPGVVTLKKGQLIFDAVNAAGGTTAEADLENINMAYKLTENVMIKVYAREKKAAKPEVKGTQPESSSTKIKGAEIITDSGGAVVEDSLSEDAHKDGQGKKVNLNTASAEELGNLPGVGEKTAEIIIDFRKNQRFEKIEDLMEIPGIGQKKFDSLKDLISI